MERVLRPSFEPWKNQLSKINKIIKQNINKSSSQNNDNLIVITGYRGTGKTFLLNNIKEEIMYNDVVTIFVNCNEYTTVQGFLDILITNMGLSTSVPNIYNDWKLRATLLLNEIIESHCYYVFIFDDINFIKPSDLEDILSLLKSYQNPSNKGLSSICTIILGIETEYLDSLKVLGHMEDYQVIELNYLTNKEINIFIDSLPNSFIFNPIACLQKEGDNNEHKKNSRIEEITKINEAKKMIRNQIVEISGGNVHLIQLLMVLAEAHIYSNNTSVESFRSKAAWIIDTVYSIEMSPQARAILRSLSSYTSSKRVSDISKELGILTAGVSNQLIRMTQKGLVIKSENNYKVVDFIKIIFSEKNKTPYA